MSSETKVENNLEKDLIKSNNQLKSLLSQMRIHCEVYKLSLRCINKIVMKLRQNKTSGPDSSQLNSKLILKHSARANYQTISKLISQKQALERIYSVLAKSKTMINGYALLEVNKTAIVDPAVPIQKLIMSPKMTNYQTLPTITTTEKTSCIREIDEPTTGRPNIPDSITDDANTEKKEKNIENESWEKTLEIVQQKPSEFFCNKQSCETTSGNDFKRTDWPEKSSIISSIEGHFKTPIDQKFSKDLMKNRSTSEKPEEENVVKTEGRCKSIPWNDESKKNRDFYLQGRRPNGNSFYLKKDFPTEEEIKGKVISSGNSTSAKRETHSVKSFNHNFIGSANNIKLYRNRIKPPRYQETQNPVNSSNTSFDQIQQIDTIQTRRVLYSTHQVIRKYNRYTNNNQQQNENNRKGFQGSHQWIFKSQNNNNTTSTNFSTNTRQRKYFRHDNKMENQGKVRRVDVYPQENTNNNEWVGLRSKGNGYYGNKQLQFQTNINNMPHTLISKLHVNKASSTVVIEPPEKVIVVHQKNNIHEMVTTKIIPQTTETPGTFLEDPRLKKRRAMAIQLAVTTTSENKSLPIQSKE